MLRSLDLLTASSLEDMLSGDKACFVRFFSNDNMMSWLATDVSQRIHRATEIKLTIDFSGTTFSAHI